MIRESRCERFRRSRRKAPLSGIAASGTELVGESPEGPKRSGGDAQRLDAPRNEIRGKRLQGDFWQCSWHCWGCGCPASVTVANITKSSLRIAAEQRRCFESCRPNSCQQPTSGRYFRPAGRAGSGVSRASRQHVGCRSHRRQKHSWRGSRRAAFFCER